MTELKSVATGICGMLGSMKASDILPFIQRDWNRVSEAKERYWIERKRRENAEECLRIAEQLRLQMKAVRPDWPTEDDRALDLKAHARLSRLMRNVDRATSR